MKTSNIWKFRSIAGKIMMVLIFAALVGSINVVTALGDDHGRNGRHDNRRYEHRGHGHDRDRYEHSRRFHGPYGYRERFYAPPPVIYEPPPAPGISIFIH